MIDELEQLKDSRPAVRPPSDAARDAPRKRLRAAIATETGAAIGVSRA